MLSSTIHTAPIDNDVTSDVFKMPKPKKRRKRRKRTTAAPPTKSNATSATAREADNTLSVATVSSTTSTCTNTTTRRRAVHKERRYFQHDTREIVKTITKSELNYAAVAKKFKPLATLNKNRMQNKPAKHTNPWHKQQMKFNKRQQQLQTKMPTKHLAKYAPHFCASSTATTTSSQPVHCNCACAIATVATPHTKRKCQKSNNCESHTFSNNKRPAVDLKQQSSIAVESALMVEELLKKLLKTQATNVNIATSMPHLLSLMPHSGIGSGSGQRISLLDSLLGAHFQHTTSLRQQQLRHVVSVRETHQIAEAQQEKNAKLREAFNISEYFVEGSSFDSDRKAKEDLAKSLALQKELDAQRESATVSKDKDRERADKRRYALVRTPSREKDIAGSGGSKGGSDNETHEHVSKSEKKKKKKRTRER
ncbi:uncharacterized protein LOC118746666 [Rhagoletis pomonella]|uniref:uncharacterized protein LOC118746666 n=1 Tax=Rhagoletis pomonella TaxID=28610 RepID=UPI001786AC79|nr:uncharacterized protein LOC118746666 [Rhagoletis pomonella]